MKTRLAWTGVAAVGFAAHAFAVTTRTWTTDSYKDFDEGDAKDAIITSLGEVMPGTTTTRTELETDALWSAAIGPDGTVYAGGVSDGAVYAVAAGKARKLASFEKETPWIGALAVGPDGTVYAGTLATGTLYRIDPRSGRATKVAQIEGAEHIWALEQDGGRMWVGTGPQGKLFEVDLATGKTKLVWDSEEAHLLALERAADGALWIGTSDEAILYRLDTKTHRARAIADFAGTEVKAIAAVPDAVVVAVNEFAARPGVVPSASSAPAKPQGTPAKPPASGPGTDKKGEAPPRSGEKKGKGGVFRVEPDGRVEQLHALSEGYFQSLAVGPDGDVYAAAGAKGRVYRIHDHRLVVTAFDVDERQVNAVLPTRDGIAFVTGDGAAIYVANGPAKDASYTSKVFDADFPARWGNVHFHGEGVMLETRSGNTSKPDRGWSAWEKPVEMRDAPGGGKIARIASPVGRYLQYRVRWNGGVGALRQVSVHYLPQNQRARITEITIGDGEKKKAPITLQNGATKPRSPVLKVSWKVDNPDDDELTYRLEVRQEGAAQWLPVPLGDEPYTKTSYEWNTEALPDGQYRLRVVASDGRQNPPDLALEHALVSPPFLIDNQKPQILGVTVSAGHASGRAVDSFSRIDELAWSVDGGDWTMLYPKDGLFDDVAEWFTIRLPAGLSAGSHILQIRAADEAGNIGATSIPFRVGR